MSYRSKRTWAHMTPKEDEVQNQKKLITPAAELSSKSVPDGVEERWGPFRPPNGGAIDGTNKHLKTSALGRKSQFISQPKNFQSKSTNCSPSNATEEAPKQSALVWKESSIPSVGQTTNNHLQFKSATPCASNRPLTSANHNHLNSKSSLPFSTNRPHTAKFSPTTPSGPSTQALTTTKSGQATQAAISPHANHLKSKSSLPFSTNRPHTANFSPTIPSGPSTQATQAAIAPQANHLKSKSSISFATSRPHTSGIVNPSTEVLAATQAASTQASIPPQSNLLKSKLKSKLVNTKSDTPPAPLNEDENLVDNVKPFKPRRHRVIVPDWPDEVAFDDKDEVMTIGDSSCYTSR